MSGDSVDQSMALPDTLLPTGLVRVHQQMPHDGLESRPKVGGECWLLVIQALPWVEPWM